MEKDTTALTTSSPHALPALADEAALQAFAHALNAALAATPSTLHPSQPAKLRMDYHDLLSKANSLHMKALTLAKKIRASNETSTPRS